MDQEELDLRLANINAFAELERQEKDRLIRETEEAMGSLKSFVEIACRESQKNVPVSWDNLRVNQVAALAVSVFQIITTELRLKVVNFERITKELECLEKECAHLKDENLKLRSQSSRIPAKESAPAVSAPTDIPANTETVPAKNDTAPTQRVVVAQEKTDYCQENNNQILIEASKTRLMKLDELIVLCASKLALPVKEIRNQIDELEKAGYFETFTSAFKPIPGYTYPTLFRLTRQGLDAARTIEVSEVDRLMAKITGLSQREIPLLVFAVEEYLPRHGYCFVNYASEKEYIDNSNERHVFIPHAQLKDEKGRTIYLMYEGDGYQDGANVRNYFKDYSVIANGEAYFLTPNNRLFTDISGKINALNYPNKVFKSVNYTNVADWAIYDRWIKESDPRRPQSVWFGRLFENKGEK